MSKFNAIQTDFTAGEISPKCFGRVDIQRYAHAAALLRNYTISPQGGSVRRSGTRYVATVPDSSQFTRIYEFRFSLLDAVVIEFSNNMIRFYKNQGLVLSGGVPYSITSIYAAADLQALKFTQSNSILYIFHPNYPTQILSRFSDTNWTIANLVFVDGPYMTTGYITGTTHAPAFTSFTCPAIAAGASGTVTFNNAIFVPTDVGRMIRLAYTSVGWGYITSYTNAQQVVVTAQAAIPVTGTASYSWNLGAFGQAVGYPSVGTFFQQRMVLAATPGQPQSFWMSQSGDLYNFGTTLFDFTVTDACGIAYTIASNEVNTIIWFSPSQVLMMGTNKAEWQISSNSYNASPVTPTNVFVTPQTQNGSLQSARALRVGWETVFVARSGRDVYKLVYSFQINGFQAKSLTLLAEHIPREGNQLLDVVYQQFPHSILWMPRTEDGALAACTYLEEQDVVGWHLHTIGGTGAFVESVACIPTPDGTKDQLWVVVRRTIGGQTARYVEYMEIPYDQSDTPKNLACFLDSATTYNGSPQENFSGANYLAGETVSVYADGSAVDDVVIQDDGTFSLPNPASVVTIGYSYESIMKVLRLEGGGSAGTSQGKKKRVHKVVVRFYETLGVEWSVDGVTWNEVPFRDAEDPAGQSPPLYSDDLPINIDQNTDYGGQYWFRQKQPYPSTILALMPEAMVNQ